MPVHTRRQSRQATAVSKYPVDDSDSDADVDAANHREEGASNASAPTMAAALSVNVPEHLAISLAPLFPGYDLFHPTEEFCVLLYTRLDEWRSDMDELRADRDRAEMDVQESETALRDQLEGIAALERDRDENYERAENVTRERDAAMAENDSLKTELTELSTSQGASSKSVEELATQVTQLQEANSRLLEMENRASLEVASYKSEREQYQERLRAARQEANEAREEAERLKAEQSNLKFKAQTLEQQLDVVRQQSEHWKAELDKISDESAAYRREQAHKLSLSQNEISDLETQKSRLESQLNALNSQHSKLLAQHQKLQLEYTELKANSDSMRALHDGATQNWEALENALQRRLNDAQTRFTELEAEWDSQQSTFEASQRESEATIAALNQELDSAKQKIEEMGTVLEELTSGEKDAARSSDPYAVLSEAAARASRMQRTGRTFSEIYADLVRCESELRQEREDHEALRKTFDDLVQQLADKQPEIVQRRHEYAAMQENLAAVTSRLNAELTAHQAAQQRMRELTSEARQSTAEVQDLRSQLADMGRQVRALMREITVRDNPLLASQPGPEEQEGWTGRPDADGPSSVDEIIDQNVAFLSLRQLQERNALLLKMIRALGRQAEDAEAGWRQQENAAIREAEELIIALQEQMDSQKVLIESLKAEADRWKAISQRQGQPDLQAQDLQSSTQSAPQQQPDLQASMLSQQDAARRRDEEMAWRREMDAQMNELRKNNGELQRSNASAISNRAKAEAQLEAQKEKSVYLENELRTAKQEVATLILQERQTANNAVRLMADLEAAERTALDAQTARDRLAVQVSNLQAERAIWKNYEERLRSENAQLSDDRIKLHDLLRGLRNSLNDVEQTNTLVKAKLEQEVQKLEGRVQDLQSHLDLDNARHTATLAEREKEVRSLQVRIDHLNEERLEVRERALKLESERDQIRARADDVAHQLEAANAKLAVYQRGEGGSGEGDVSKEEMLQAEVADLRAQAKTLEAKLRSAEGQANQYSSIARANEEALASATASASEYERSTAELLKQKDAEIEGLRANIALATEQLTSAQEESDRLRHELENQEAKWKEEKKMFEEMVADHAVDEARVASERDAQREEIRRLNLLAAENDQKYRQELIGHGEAEKRVIELNGTLRSLQNEINKFKTDADTAVANLRSSEASWVEQRSGLEQQIRSLESRVQQLIDRNQELLQHVESVNISVRRTSGLDMMPTTNGSVAGDVDARVKALETVNSYLRNDKDVLEAELNMQKSKVASIQATLDWQTKQLQEKELQLADERVRAAETMNTAQQHQQLLDKVNELSTLRESNTLLRQQKDDAVKRRDQAEQKIRDLMAELEPLRLQKRELEADLQASQGRVEQLQVDNERWKARTQGILQKYERIDPDEFQAVKDERDVLKASLEAEKTQRDGLELTHKEHIERLEQNLKQYREKYNGLVDAYKKRATELQELRTAREAVQKELESVKTQHAALETKRQEAMTEIDRLDEEIERLQEFEKQVEGLQADLERERNSAEGLRTIVSDLEKKVSELGAVQQERDQLLAAKETSNANPAASTESASSEELQKITAERDQLRSKSQRFFEETINARKELTAKQKELNEANAKIKELESKVATLEAQLASVGTATVDASSAAASDLQRALDDALVQIEKLKSTEAQPVPTGASDAELEALKAHHVEELSKLQAEIAAQKASAEKSIADAKRMNTEKVREVIDKRLKAQEEQLNRRFEELKAAAVQEAVSKHDSDLAERQKAAIEAALTTHRMETNMRNQLNSLQMTKQKLLIARLNRRVTQLLDVLKDNDVTAPEPEPDPEEPGEGEKIEGAAGAPEGSIKAETPIVEAAPQAIPQPHPTEDGVPSRASEELPSHETSSQTRQSSLPPQGSTPAVPTAPRIQRPPRTNPFIAAVNAAASSAPGPAHHAVMPSQPVANGSPTRAKRGRDTEDEAEPTAPVEKKARVILQRPTHK